MKNISIYDESIKRIFSYLNHRSSLTLVAARPGFGKTALLLQLAEIISKYPGKKVIFFSLELLKKHVVMRMEKMGLSSEDITIIDKYDVSEEDIRNIVLSSKNQCVIFIDYLQLLDPALRLKLSSLARELFIHIIISSGLSRGFEDLPDGKPTLDYFKSLYPIGSKEYPSFNDYDVILFLWRPHKCERGIGTAYAYDIQPEGEFIIAKNNFGENKIINTTWNAETLCFY